VELTPQRSEATGLIASLAALTMLFSALLSAYVVRRGISDDWTPLHIPVVLYLSVVPGAAVSLVLRTGHARLAATGAALLFTAIHLASWRELAHAGTASVDFLSVISGMVGLAAAGGTVGIVAARQNTLTWYWHYLNLLWVAILSFLGIRG
jgi:cytochrome c oxidase subunit 3